MWYPCSRGLAVSVIFMGGSYSDSYLTSKLLLAVTKPVLSSPLHCTYSGCRSSSSVFLKRVCQAVCSTTFNKCPSRFHSVFPSDTGGPGEWPTTHEELCDQGFSWGVCRGRRREKQEDVQEERSKGCAGAAQETAASPCSGASEAQNQKEKSAHLQGELAFPRKPTGKDRASPVWLR